MPFLISLSRRRLCPFVLLVVFVGAMLVPRPVWAAEAGASRRPGAVRALRLKAAEADVRLPRSVFNAAFAPDGGAARVLVFTGEDSGTRNLWRAVTDRQEAGATWLATSLTRLRAPAWADQAVPLPDGHSLLCITNAFEARSSRSLATSDDEGRLASLDGRSGRLTTLGDDARVSWPAVSPDGRRLAWVSRRSGLPAVWMANLEFKSGEWRLREEKRVAMMATRPCWLDNQALAFAGTTSDRNGIFRFALNPGATPRDEQRDEQRNEQRDERREDGRDRRHAVLPTGIAPIFERPGAMARASTGQLCVAPASNDDAGTGELSPVAAGQGGLYLMAPDGSGARAVPGVADANSPAFAPEGEAIVFDAPLSASDSARALFWLPMLNLPPVALLLEARPALIAAQTLNGEVEIIGTAFSETGEVRARLEAGIGEDPAQWTLIATPNAPVHQAVLARWRPPEGANGDWTLRLTVTDSTGERIQSTLPLTLPLQAAPPLPPYIPPPAPQQRDIAPSRPPVLGGPSSSAPPAMPRPPISRPPASARTPVAAGRVVPLLPLPALPPAPPEASLPPSPGAPTSGTALPAVTPRPAAPPVRAAQGGPLPATSPVARPQGGALPGAPSPQPPARNSLPAGGALPATGPMRRGPMVDPPPISLPPLPRRAPVAAPVRVVAPSAASPRQAAPVAGGRDAARVQITGTPATLRPGETVTVSALLQNTGSRAWTTEGVQPVRLLVRWTDLTTRNRTRWTITWLRASVLPGGRLRLAVPLGAPLRPGRFKVSYSLWRLDGPRASAPAISAGSPWPGEFGGEAYLVIVR